MGHVAEKDALFLSHFLRSRKSVFQDLMLLQLLLLFQIDIPETHDHFVKAKTFIENDPDADPFIGVAETSAVVAAKFIDLIFYQLTDIFQRKALLKFFISAFFHNLSYSIQHMAVYAFLAQLLLYVRGGLDGAVSTCLKIDAVNGVVGVAQDL